jgi:hypothetical protein
MKPCPRCGARVADAASFCDQCGAPFGAAVDPSSVHAPGGGDSAASSGRADPVCDRCGRPLRQGVRFCAGCGAQVAGAPGAAVPVAGRAAAAAAVPGALSGEPASPTRPGAQPAGAPPRRAFPVWAIVAICVAVAAAAGVAIWLATRDGGGGGQATATHSSSGQTHGTPAAEPSEPSAPVTSEPDVLPAASNISYLCAASATSTLPDDDDITYGAENAIDGVRRTCWAEGSPGYGVGESVRFEFSETVVVSRINVLPGYYKYTTGWDRWWTNGRLRTVRLTWSDGSSQTYSFDDRKGWQSIDFEPDTVTTDSVELTVVRVYRADMSHPNAAADTSMSEIQFVGWPLSEVAE